MDFPRCTARRFCADCRAVPQNAKLYPDEVLLEISSEEASLRAKSVALAELAVRQMLKPDRYQKEISRFDVNGALGDLLGDGALARFREECERCAVSASVERAAARAFGCFPSGGDARETLCLNDLMAAFRPWLEASGVIPVFNSQGGYLLPFKFVARATVGSPCVMDAVGTEIPEWTEHFCKFADAEGINCDVMVDIRQTDSARGRGNSMMLPVLMAWWRKRGDLPRYDVLRFIATGSCEGRKLGQVDVAEKESMVARDVLGGLLVRPGHDNLPGVLPVGIGRDELKRRLCELAEESYDCSPSYAASRLLALDRMVRERHVGDWKPLNDRLEHLFANVTAKDGEEYLWGLMLRSAACCHAGQTERAHELNEQARTVASGLPQCHSQMLRLQIEELVILQDEEDFEKVYRLAPDLGKEIDEYAKQENDSNRAVDLKMRYWGTMGQFWLYDAVRRQDEGMKARAREAIEKAWQFASELYSRSKMENDGTANCSAFANCAQDANYRLLWTAFFAREKLSAVAKEAREEANSLRCSRDEGGESGADKNDKFRRRILALGQYRAVLDGDLEVPEGIEDAGIRNLAENEESWLSATTCKYLGAVAAKRNDADSAVKWFRLADEKMGKELEHQDGLVMRVIHMTIRAEAYRSLRRIPSCVSLAQEMRMDALGFFNGDGCRILRGKEDFFRWLQQEDEDSRFPGLAYWY